MGYRWDENLSLSIADRRGEDSFYIEWQRPGQLPARKGGGIGPRRVDKPEMANTEMGKRLNNSTAELHRPLHDRA